MNMPMRLCALFLGCILTASLFVMDYSQGFLAIAGGGMMATIALAAFFIALG